MWATVRRHQSQSWNLVRKLIIQSTRRPYFRLELCSCVASAHPSSGFIKPGSIGRVVLEILNVSPYPWLCTLARRYARSLSRKQLKPLPTKESSQAKQPPNLTLSFGVLCAVSGNHGRARLRRGDTGGHELNRVLRW